jgi:hypothetical protein
MLRRRSLLPFLLVLTGGCTGGGTSAGPQPEGSAQSEAHPSTPPPAGHTGGTPTPATAPPAGGQNWDLTATAQPPYHAGSEGRFEVHLSGRNGYHVNQEYPIRLTIRPPEGVTLPKATLQRTDASTFAETGAIFPVAFTAAAAGHKDFGGELSFSVCNAQNCLLEREPVNLGVDVQ